MINNNLSPPLPPSSSFPPFFTFPSITSTHHRPPHSPPMDSPLLLLLLLLLLFLSISNASAFNPSTAYFLNCGSSTNTTFPHDNPSRTFTSDSQFLSSSSTVSLGNPVSTQSSSLYNSARLFTEPSSYTFTINTIGTHVLRLHFSPFTTPTHNLITSSNFSVSAQTFLLLSSFSPPNITIKEYYLWLDSSQLTLTFTPNFSPTSLAFISAIELFTAPPFLIDNTTEPASVSPTGSDLNIGNLTHQALETLYRVNVGGQLITPANDTLWRTWTPDDGGFLFSKSTSKEDSIRTDKIVYGPDPRRSREIAPEFVYSSVREMDISNETRLANPNFDVNITWAFPVPAGYKYFIRMHFCDFVSAQALDLVFDVFIGDLSARQDLRLGLLTSQAPDTACYLDFVVADDVVGTSGFLNVSVGRSRKSTPETANAIMNGLEIMKINNSVGSLDGIFNSIAANSNKKRSGSLPVILASTAAAAVLVLIITASTIFFLIRKRSKPAPSPSTPKVNTATPVSWSPYHNDSINKSSSGATPRAKVELELYIPLSDIKRATNEFDEALLIGHGGFGNVYKGVLPDGTKVAVKRAMRGSRQGYPEFQNEISLLSRIRHRHLVSLVGYCDEMGEMILVYEFMEKGTLKSYLYGSPDLPCLTWKQRLQVCIGAGRGLHYLHTAHSQVIIHRDVKSTNILLGEEYLAKVSDFGLSKLGPSLGETHVSTGVKGSFGYLDPEYFKMQKLTTKSDVYSFGVVLFEVLCARPVIDPMLGREELNLAEWALLCQRKGQLEKIIDQRLAGQINPKSLKKFGETAERCLAEYGVDRPTIGDVLWNLEYALQLQETELRREPHEDSGTVLDPQIQSVDLARRVPSISDTIDEDDLLGLSGVQLDANPSKVFSQLIGSEGR